MVNAKKIRSGAWLIALASAIGVGISIYDYITPATGIDGTEGVILVGASSALMLAASLAWATVKSPACWLYGFFIVSILLDIIGTATASYFLESCVLLAAMALGAIGWLMQIMTKRVEA